MSLNVYQYFCDLTSNCILSCLGKGSFSNILGPIPYQF